MRPTRRSRLGPSLALALACLVVAGGAAPCCAEDGVGLLRAEFWADLEPVSGVGEPWPVPPDEARRRILEEAAWVYSGVIWGFEFSYTPLDRTRALEERFDIAPIGTLNAASLSFVPGAGPARSDELRYLVECRPDPGLVSLMGSYASEPWKGSQGIGRADMNGGVKGRREAYKDALRSALRSWLQGLEPNKPRLVRGRVVFDRPPSMAIIGGYYTSQARVRAMVTEVLPYKIY